MQLQIIKATVFIAILFLNTHLYSQNCFGPVDGSTVFIDCAGVPDFATAQVGLTNEEPSASGIFGTWTIISGPATIALNSGNTATLDVTGPGPIVIQNDIATIANPATIIETCTQTINAACYASDIGDNPDITTDCPVNITLVIDESGSIGVDPAQISQVETAVNTLVSELAANTETNMSIIEFETFARDAVINGSIGFQIVDAAYATGVAAYLTGGPAGTLPNGQDDPSDPASYTPGEDVNALAGGTNWENALLAVDPTSDIVIFITDGNPTFYSETGIPAGVAGEGNVLDLTALSNAQVAANNLKAAGAHVFFLGVGPDVLLQPIIEASGPDAYDLGDDLDAFCAGDFSITNFPDLEPCLIDIAAQIATKQNCEEPIPTMGEWGLICLSFMMMIFAIVAIRQRELVGATA